MLDEPTVEPHIAAASRRDSNTRRVLALVDLGTLGIAYTIATALAGTSDSTSERLVLLAALPLWVLLNKLLGLYDRDASLIGKSTIDELPRVAQSLLVGVGLSYLIVPSVTSVTFSRAGTITFLAIGLVLSPTARALTRAALRSRSVPERCLIVGTGPVSEMLARKLEEHRHHAARIVGFVDIEPDEADGSWIARDEGVPYFPLGEVAKFEQICRAQHVERVVFGFSGLSPETMLELIQASKLLDLKVTVLPRFFEVIGHSVEQDNVDGLPLLGIKGFARTRSSLLLKRSLDVSVSAIGLLLTGPLLAALAVAIKLTSPGPVLYSQPRIGRSDEAFSLYKFRTMVVGADELKPRLAHLNEAKGPMFKIAADPRVTGVGAFLRRTSFDELPQLWNVLRGEMSLVGPRPLVPEEDDHVLGWHRSRLDLTPGLTGPWQVLGRTRIPFQEMVKLDYLYVAEWSLWNDIKLLLRTVPVVLLSRGQ